MKVCRFVIYAEQGNSFLARARGWRRCLKHVSRSVSGTSKWVVRQSQC